MQAFITELWKKVVDQYSKLKSWFQVYYTPTTLNDSSQTASSKTQENRNNVAEDLLDKHQKEHEQKKEEWRKSQEILIEQRKSYDEKQKEHEQKNKEFYAERNIDFFLADYHECPALLWLIGNNVSGNLSNTEKRSSMILLSVHTKQQQTR